MLKSQKQELQSILEGHHCVMINKSQIDVKPIVSNGTVIVSNSTQSRRPTSLAISNTYLNSTAFNSNKRVDDSLVPIQTPSAGISLEHCMEGTGLTPILNGLITPISSILTPTSMPSTTNGMPSCGGQQRNSSTLPELSSPDSVNSHKLVSL